jgi:DNA polymerase-3 subunit beta
LERVDTEYVIISSDDSQIIVTADNMQYVSRVVDAPFPNYKEIIPKTFTTDAVVLKSDFSEMLRKARVFAGVDQQIGLHIYPSRKIFSATASSNNVGEMSDTIDAAVSGEDLDIKFHIGYLADCLSSIKSDSIALNFSGANRAMVIKGVSDQGFLYLAMPLNR